jgi:hypothetical protein
MRLGLLGPISILSIVGCAVGPPRTAPSGPIPSNSLPVRSVRLYETGVGYFEREGRLTPGADGISLPASHVDDALKTLIVLSDGVRVRVSAVAFESVLSEGLARAQAGLPPGKGQQLTYPVVLGSLRGLEVELVRRDGARLLGRLVDVSEITAVAQGTLPASEHDPSSGETGTDGGADDSGSGESGEQDSTGAERAADGTPDGSKSGAVVPLRRYAITLLGSDSAVVRLDSSQVASLRPTDPALAARLMSAIGTVSERGAQGPRTLRVSASGNSPVRLGYISETPVFRVTYRLLLGRKSNQGTLQGWVLVHNDTDEPWQKVGLEIVNGRPDSYLFPLTAPRYLRRPLSTPEEMSTLPQLARRTVDQIWGDRDESADEGFDSFGAGGLSLSGVGEGGGGQGFGSGHGRLSGSSSSSSTSEITVGNLASIAESKSLASGARFHYRMAEPISLAAHSSALVPFTEVAIGARLMTRFAWGQSAGRVSVQISNSSAQTLPGGPLAIYEASGFVGESLVSRLVPGQDTWVSYGADLDVEVVQSGARVEKKTIKLLRFENQRLIEHYIRHREQPVRIVNRSALARSVCIDLPLVDNAKVEGADRLVYDSGASNSLAVFELKAHSKLDRKLVFDEGLQAARPLESLTEADLALLAAEKELTPGARAVLLEARALLVRHTAPIQAKRRKRDNLERIEADTQRLERTIEKLKGTSGNAAEPLVRRVVELEERRNRLELEQETLAEAEAQRLPALSAILEKLNAIPKTG